MSRAMKDSGIPWIGEIPKNWGIYRIKYNTFLKGRIGWQGLNSNDFLDKGYCLITGTDFDNKGGINWSTCYRISKERFDEDELLHIKCGDLLMTKDGTVGKMAYIKQLPEEASLNSHLLIIRQLSELMDNSYLYWVMLSPVFKEFCAIFQAGTIMSSISQSTLGLFCCHLPSKKEQQCIAEFLDRKCGEIDEAIALQEEFIEELKAYKQSVITETVTRGLNPNVKFKDSGIDWIGKIPQGWELKKVKYVSTSINKGTGITKDEVFEDGDTPCVRYGEIYSKYNGSFVNCKSYTKKNILTAYRYFNTSDILFAGTGELVEEIGKSIVYLGEKPALAGGDIIILSHNQNPVFLNYALNSFYAQTQKSRGKAKLKVVHISSSEIGNIYLMLPPAAEQLQIADYLDSKCAEIDGLIAIKQQKIEELKDYKKSIIYEYVTGKKECIF